MNTLRNKRFVVGWPGHDPGTYGLKGRNVTRRIVAKLSRRYSVLVTYIEPSATRLSEMAPVGRRLWASFDDRDLDHGHHHGGAE